MYTVISFTYDKDKCKTNCGRDMGMAIETIINRQYDIACGQADDIGLAGGYMQCVIFGEELVKRHYLLI